jgi:hypothetical protein
MEQNIKAIETKYNGYRFRSRLEARWAVFFDTLGVAYEYEKEGFDLGEAGFYLPDFWFPELGCWGEVKPGPLTVQERAKCWALTTLSRQNCILLAPDYLSVIFPIFYISEDNETCYGEKIFIFGAEGTSCAIETKEMPLGDSAIQRWPGMVDAMDAARQARFEFGESGAPRSAQE